MATGALSERKGNFDGHDVGLRQIEAAGLARWYRQYAASKARRIGSPMHVKEAARIAGVELWGDSQLVPSS